ncbi:MAG: hypothetical protein OXU20_21635 [Myxococcales bacterium]|nr:hypothetical protein [Myxococcales bacterium]MDD9966989.1 hypothetical protein [Myxococcales bacterium]
MPLRRAGRLGVASRLEAADLTSIQERLRAARPAKTPRDAAASTPRHLAPMADDRRSRRSERLPIDLVGYVELLEWTGRAARTGGGGRLGGDAPSLLTNLGISRAQWYRAMGTQALATCSALGRIEALDAEATRRGLAWLRGKGLSRRLAS